MRLILLCMLSILSAAAGADFVDCKVVREADSDCQIFDAYDGGYITVDLETGNAELSTLPPGVVRTVRPLVSDSSVTTYEAKRETCQVSTHVSRAADGALLGFEFTFDNCMLLRTNSKRPSAIVGALESFDSAKNGGVFAELYYDGKKTVVPYFSLSNCKLRP